MENNQESPPPGPLGPLGPCGPQGSNSVTPPEKFHAYLVQTMEDNPENFQVLTSVTCDIGALASGRLDVLSEMINKIIEDNNGVGENQKIYFSLAELKKYEEEE